MQKLKNLSLVSNTSKLYSENRESYIFPKFPPNTRRTLTFQAEKNDPKNIMKNKSDDKAITEDAANVNNSKKLILYIPLVDLKNFNYLTRIQENFSFNSINLCAGCTRFLEIHREDTKCTALVPTFYNSRAFTLYSKPSSNYINATIKFNEILKHSFQYTTKNYQTQNQEKKAVIEDYVDRYPSKFALCLSDISEEIKDVSLPKNGMIIEISRNCRSCPAVVSIRRFPSKFSQRRTESKVLLLNCDNFAKFQMTFTRLLAKNKVRNVKPLLRNLEIRDHQILTKLERALINHNLRINKNNDTIKRNVIMMKPKNIRNSKEQTEEIKPRENTSIGILKHIISNTNNENMGKKKIPSKIMIINDQIFHGRTEDNINKHNFNNSERRNSIIYLNNDIFKDLKIDTVNKILNRKYTNYKDEEKDILVRIPTRRTSKKLKPCRSTDEKCEECHEIPLENLIVAVAESKRLEYIERSKMSWKIFKQLEKTLEKVKILHFPPQAAIHDHHEQSNKNESQNSEPSKINSYNTRKRKTTVQEYAEFGEENGRIKSPHANENLPLKIKAKRERPKDKRTTQGMEKKVENFRINPHQLNARKSIGKERVKFLGGCKSKSPYTKEDVSIETKPNKDYARSRNTPRTKLQDKMLEPINNIDESRKGKAQLKITDNQEIKLNKQRNCGVKKARKRGDMQNVKMDTSAMGKTVKKVSENTIFLYKKNSNPEKNENEESLLPIKPPPAKTTNHEREKTVEVSKTKNESNAKEDKTTLKMSKKTLTKSIVPKKEDLKKNRKLSFEEQDHLTLEEEKNPVIFLHKNPNSLLSSSQSEIIGDLEKPKTKLKKLLESQNETSTKELYPKDSANEREVKLFVGDFLGWHSSPKIEKSRKPPDKKTKSKLPILGTPTTITRHIEKVVATALATRKIREKFNEQEVHDDIDNFIQEKIGNGTKAKPEKIKSVDLEQKINEENTDKIESEKINNYVNISERIKNDSKNAVKIENIEERDKRSEIDYILAMNSSPVHKERPNSTEKKKLQNNRINESFNDCITAEQENKSDGMDIQPDNFGVKNTNIEDKNNKMRSLKNKLKEKIVSISENLTTEDIQNMKIRDGTETENMSIEKNMKITEKIQMNTPDTIIICNIGKEHKKIDDSIKHFNKNTKVLNENKSDIIIEKNRSETLLPENMEKHEKIETKFSVDDSIKNGMENINSKGELVENKGTEHKEKLECSVDREIRKEGKENSITIFDIENEDTKIEDSIKKFNNTNTKVLNENKSNMAIGKNRSETPLPENMEKPGKIETIFSVDDSIKKSMEKLHSKGELVENIGTEQKEKLGCSIDREIRKEGKENSITIYDTEIEDTKEYDAIENVNTHITAMDSSKNEKERNCSKLTINHGTGKKKNMAYKFGAEKEETGVCGKKTGKNIMEIHDTESIKIGDLIENIENKNTTEVIENKNSSAMDKHKVKEPPQRELILGETKKNSTITSSRTQKEIKNTEDILNKSGFGTYLSEKQIESSAIVKIDTKDKENVDVEEIMDNEKKEKSTEYTISIADPEVIRKKRLIYFKNKMKNNSELKEIKSEKKIDLKSGTTQPENNGKKENESSSLQSPKSIENSSQTAEMENNVENQQDQTSGRKSFTEKGEFKETQNSSSQYDNPSNNDRSEKAIETETEHKDAAITVKHESSPHETEKIVKHRTLSQSASDNVIVIKAARTDSEESVQGITKSFLKQVLDRMNFVQNSKLKNHTMQKYREIAVKLKKSREKFIRNVPSSIHKICKEAREIKYKLSRTKIMRNRSTEIINKFTKTFDSANQAELKNTRRPSCKPGIKVKSVIERNVTSKIKLLTKLPIRTNTKKKNLCNVEPKSEVEKQIKQVPSPCLSMSELQNRSIGSLFADTVAAALSRCGDVDQIMSKYSDSLEKISSDSEPDRNIKTSAENPRDLVEDFRRDTNQKEDEFLMSDGVRKLVLNVIVKRTENCSSDDEWKLYPEAALVKKSNSDGETQIALNKSENCIPTSQAPSSTKLVTGLQEQSNLFSSINDDAGECIVPSHTSPEEQQQSNITDPNHDDEANALEETKKDLTKLKILLQEEKERSIGDIDSEDDRIELFKNNESFYIKIHQEEKDAPTSIADLNTVLVSEMNTRTAEGSTSPPPPSIAKSSILQEENETTSKDVKNNEKIHREQMNFSGEKKLDIEERLFFGKNSTVDLKNIDVIPKCLTHSDVDLMEVNSPEIFMTPFASNTDFNKISDSLKDVPIPNLKVSEVLPLVNTEDCSNVSRGIQNPDKCDQLKPTKSPHKSMEFHPNQGVAKFPRKDDIELSCKLSYYPKSLICRENNRNIAKTALGNRESIVHSEDNVLNEGNKEENLNEIFIDLERMGNCILKSVPSKDKLSNEEHKGPKNGTLKNNTRTFTTDNSDDYSRFKEWKREEKKIENSSSNDLESLDQIHDEALNDEIFFGRETKKRKKESKKGSSDDPRPSIYQEFVRNSELNGVEQGGIGNSYGYRHHSPLEHREILSEELNETKLGCDTEDQNRYAPDFRGQTSAQQKPCLSESGHTLQKHDDTIEQIDFEVLTGQNNEACVEESKSEHSKGENVVIDTSAKSEGLCDNLKKTGNTSTIEQEENNRRNEEQSLTKKTGMLDEGKKHKILEKFALISQEPDTAIFKINNYVKFDRVKKNMCQPENIVPKSKKTNYKREESPENPRMIVKLSPTKEPSKPPIAEMSDNDIKNLLLQQPKMLMKIASDIMSKNQYLSFLLDLKSTKELKEYWMNKIRDGIVYSRSFRDLTNIMGYLKADGVKKGAENNVVSQEEIHRVEEDTKLSEDSIESKRGSESTNKESSDFRSIKSDIDLDEMKTTLEQETGKPRPKNRQSTLSSLPNKMLKKGSKDGESSRRNLSSQHEDILENGYLPYSLEKYLKSPMQISDEKLRTNNESSKFSRVSRNLHGRDIEMEITHENFGKKRILPVKARVGRILELKKGKTPSIRYGKELSTKSHMEKNEDSVSLDHQNGKNICYEILESNQTKGEEGYLIDTEGEFDEKKANPQQTAIVLPGREPIKISLISDEISVTPVASIKDHCEKNALEDLSDVLSNCSSPVSSLCSKEGKKGLKNSSFKRTHKTERLQDDTATSSTNSSVPTDCLQKTQANSRPNGLHLKKFKNPLKEFVQNHDDSQTTDMTDQLSNIENINASRTGLDEARTIRVIRTKSLSEMLKEDPDILKKIKEKGMLDASKEEEAAKRFEYRFHDFRRKEDKCLEMSARRQEEQKRDLFTKFKCLIQSRKEATERNRQNIRSNENQQIHPKVFSKILEKISYFKVLEEQPNTERSGDPVVSEKSVISNNKGDTKSPGATNGNRRMLHTKRKQINEDKLVTWVQEHPEVPAKRRATENVENCDRRKQNVIHIPWTPNFHEVGAKN